MPNNLNDFVPNVHFEQIRIKDLVSNQNYQRSLSKSHINHSIENFDLYQINPVKVSRRDGINYVFNGQHTIEVIARVSNSRDTPVWCMIYDDLDYSSEADIFANQQKCVKPLSPYEVFHANIEAGNDKQLIIKTLVESFGLQISPCRVQGGICAIGTLEYIYDHYGLEILNRTIHLITLTWEGDINSYGSNLLKGISKFLYVFKDQVKDLVFIEKCGRLSAKEILRRAKDLHAGSFAVAEILLQQYNQKSKGGLSRKKLYDEMKPSYIHNMEAEDDIENIEDEEDLREQEKRAE